MIVIKKYYELYSTPMMIDYNIWWKNAQGIRYIKVNCVISALYKIVK